MKSMNKKRNAALAAIVEQLKNAGEDVGYIASNKINYPVVDAEGNEGWLQIAVSVPLGANHGKEPYDGYGERESYEMRQKERAAKLEEAAKKKAAKIAAQKAAKAAKEKEGD